MTVEIQVIARPVPSLPHLISGIWPVAGLGVGLIVNVAWMALWDTGSFDWYFRIATPGAVLSPLVGPNPWCPFEPPRTPRQRGVNVAAFPTSLQDRHRVWTAASRRPEPLNGAISRASLSD